MKADLVLVISPEAPLMKQLGKVLGKMVTPYDFSTIERGEKQGLWWLIRVKNG